MTSFKSLVKKHPLFAFYFLAFLLTWLGWGPQALHSRGLFPFDSIIFYVLGGIGPLLAVYIVLRGKEDLREIFGPLGQWRAHPVWYAAALLGYPLLWLATIALDGVLGPELAMLPAPMGMLTGFLIYIAAAIPEEIAWRGFALPRLQARHNALFSSAIVGLMWGLWHLPLLLNLNNSMSGYPIGLYLIDVLGRSVIYAWLYNNTRGSLLFVVLFHAASNIVGNFIGYENLIVTYVSVGALIVLFGADDLTLRGGRHTIQDAPTGAGEQV